MTEHKSRAVRLPEGVILHRQGGRTARRRGRTAPPSASQGLPSPRAGRWQGAQDGFMHNGKGAWPIPAVSVLQPCQNSYHNCPSRGSEMKNWPEVTHSESVVESRSPNRLRQAPAHSMPLSPGCSKACRNSAPCRDPALAPWRAKVRGTWLCGLSAAAVARPCVLGPWCSMRADGLLLSLTLHRCLHAAPKIDAWCWLGPRVGRSW